MWTIKKNPAMLGRYADEATPRWRQSLLRLTRFVTIETRRRCVCIPDRTSAEYERAKLQREYGPALIAVKITKNGAGPNGTYTCAYTLRETKTEELF